MLYTRFTGADDCVIKPSVAITLINIEDGPSNRGEPTVRSSLKLANFIAHITPDGNVLFKLQFALSYLQIEVKFIRRSNVSLRFGFGSFLLTILIFRDRTKEDVGRVRDLFKVRRGERKRWHGKSRERRGEDNRDAEALRTVQRSRFWAA